MLSKNKIIVFTDGACSGNPGPGGFAAILLYKTKKGNIGI
jgi:ribonuclease HI